MAARIPGVCVFCLKPADMRTGKVTELPCGARLHNLCITPLMIELAEASLKPRPGRRTLGHRDRLTPTR